uniref:Ribosome receptor lysine/proline rich domain-containing protein n=1 Tax=Arion vulgaris TaxID=1028688 RepID=A0A0B7BLT8_9EUPU
MEVVTILIGVAVFIISALLLYFISAFSMREKTFEEVIEEQRRREEEEREKVKAERKAQREQHKNKHSKKGQGKQEKSKEKTAQVVEPELKVEPKMVNLEIEPEIIEPTETLGLNTGLRQRGKKEKTAKSILQNKGEHTPVVEKAAELHHKPVVPKDEFELKKVMRKL